VFFSSRNAPARNSKKLASNPARKLCELGALAVNPSSPEKPHISRKSTQLCALRVLCGEAFFRSRNAAPETQRPPFQPGKKTLRTWRLGGESIHPRKAAPSHPTPMMKRKAAKP
jgi:hypothetical protein